MANLNKLYSEFNNRITLTTSKSDSLRKSRDALRSDIKKWFSDNDNYQPKFCMQGSFAMRTVVNPIDNGEYDLDDGIYLQGYEDVDQTDWPSPSTAHKWIKDAVSDRTSKNPIDKNTCVRVIYAEGYHIDLPIYIIQNNTAFLAHKTDGWIESDPKAFKDWFVDKVHDDQHGEQLRRGVKVLKAWADYNEIDLKGIELTILATNEFEQYENRDDKCFINTVEKIILNLEYHFRCIKPVIPGEDLFVIFDEEGKKKIIRAFKSLKKSMDCAIAEIDEEKASEYLRDVFGPGFPKGTSSKNSSVLGVLRHDGRSA